VLRRSLKKKLQIIILKCFLPIRGSIFNLYLNIFCKLFLLKSVILASSSLFYLKNFIDKWKFILINKIQLHTSLLNARNIDYIDIIIFESRKQNKTKERNF